MDRCALFVDAGYMLADGAMAVHGTRRRESVSWDYEGLVQLLGNLARDRTGLPLLRCYWYEATVEGRRTAEHDALADMPGIKLRLAKLRPGRREGVETEIHRDLTVLARNRAVGDAVVVSAEEDLAQVLSDVQDLGLRVTIVHVTVDGNWTISRSLRQECDDIMELTSAHLRPYVELIPGAAPARADEQYPAGALSARSASNGHSNGSADSYQALPSGSGSAGPPSIYTAPVVAEYQRPAQPIAPSYRQDPEPEPPARDDPAAGANSPLAFGRPEAPGVSGVPGVPSVPERAEPARPEPPRSEPGRGDTPRTDVRRGDLPSAGMRGDFDRGGFDAPEPAQRDRGDRGRADRGRSDPGVSPLPSPAGRNDAVETEPATRQDLYGAPVSMPFRGTSPAQPAAADDLPGRAESGGQAVRSQPVTSPSRPGRPRGLSHRRARQARSARRPGAVRPPATTPAASGAPRSRPPTGPAARRTSSAGNRSIHTASGCPRRRDRSAARVARPRPRRWGPRPPGPARRPRRIRPRATGRRGRRAHQRRALRCRKARRVRRPTSLRRAGPTAGPSPPRPDGRRRQPRYR